MKNFIYYFTVCVTFFYFHTAQSQFTEIGDNFNRFNPRISVYDKSEKKIEGSPYLSSVFIPAKISILKEIHSVKYDAYNDQMEIEKDGKVYYLPKNELNYTVTLLKDNKTYRVFTFTKSGETTTGFFNVLLKNESAFLLKKEAIILRKEKVESNGYNSPKPAKYLLQLSKYFVSFKNGTAIKVPTRKKQFLSLFGSYKIKMSTFIKKNKLNLKKENDLCLIFNYYDKIYKSE